MGHTISAFLLGKIKVKYIFGACRQASGENLQEALISKALAWQSWHKAFKKSCRVGSGQVCTVRPKASGFGLDFLCQCGISKSGLPDGHNSGARSLPEFPAACHGVGTQRALSPGWGIWKPCKSSQKLQAASWRAGAQSHKSWGEFYRWSLVPGQRQECQFC